MCFVVKRVASGRNVGTMDFQLGPRIAHTTNRFFCFIISTFVLKYTKKRNGLNSLGTICTIRRFPFYFGVVD